MSDGFHIALDVVLAQEGAYSNHANDPGGETKWGISHAAYPDLNIATLSKDEATAIYHRDYWVPLHLSELPPAIAVAVFDGAVNQGRRPSVRLLQHCLGATMDGVCGPRTIAAARAANLPDLLGRYLARRAVYYSHLVTWGDFGLGWMSRLFAVHRTCVALLAKEGP